MSVRTRWLGRRFRSGAAAAFGAALLVSLGTREARAGGLGTSVTVEPIFRDVPPSEGWTDVLVTIDNADDAAFTGTIESGGDEGASSPRVTHAVAVAPHGTKATRFPVRVPRYGHSPVVVGVRDARGALVARRTVPTETGSHPPTLVDVGARTPSSALRNAEVWVQSGRVGSRSLLRVGSVARDPATHAPVLPTRTAAYAGVDVVRATVSDLAALENAEMLALSTFVLQGGTLLLTGATTADLDHPRVAPMVDKHGAPFGRSSYGLGEVVFDTDGDGNVPAAVGRAHDRRALRVFPSRSLGDGDDAVESDAIERALDPNESFRGALGASAVLLVLYAILAGPVLHLRARKRGKPFTPLLGAPLLAAGAFGAVVGIGLVSRGVNGRARHVAIVEASAGASRGTGVLFRGFFTNRRQRLDVRALGPTSSLARLESGDTAADHLVADGRTLTLSDFVALPWQSSIVRETGYARDLGGTVDVERRDGRLFVHNGLGTSLVDVIVAEGDTARYFAVVPVGASIDSSEGTRLPDHRSTSVTVHDLAAYRLRGNLPDPVAERVSARWQLAEGLARGADFWPDENVVVLAEVDAPHYARDDSGVALESDRLLLRVVGTGTRRSP